MTVQLVLLAVPYGHIHTKLSLSEIGSTGVRVHLNTVRMNNEMIAEVMYTQERDLISLTRGRGWRTIIFSLALVRREGGREGGRSKCLERGTDYAYIPYIIIWQWMSNY